MGDVLVTPLFEREPDSVPGPFYVVKDLCIICGLPPETAPQNITWSKQTFLRDCEDCPSHCRVERQPKTEEEISAMIQAACSSCVGAIRYCGTDPAILKRLPTHLCDAVREKL